MARLSVLLLADSSERRETIRAAITQAGHDVAAQMSPLDERLNWSAAREPDLLVWGADSLHRRDIERIHKIVRDRPLPVILFTSDSDPEHIRAAIRAGVSAYVVDGFSPQRIKAIIEVAVARFCELQALQRELVETRGKLTDRKLIERAKGILMKTRDLDEDEAHRVLRKEAMARSLRLADMANQIIVVSELLADSKEVGQPLITGSKQS